MKDDLQRWIHRFDNPLQAVHRTREFLQTRLLHLFQRFGAMAPLAFHGGTALRFLYQIPRFSEHLDFALERPHLPFSLSKVAGRVQESLEQEGYRVDVRLKTEKTVQAAWFRFRGLLYELHLSPHPEQILTIKVEVDTCPPQGATLEVTVLRRFAWLLRIQHHDLPSILAGKIHALLQRPYLKGRDVYDLLWILSIPNPPEPNLELLRHALAQTRWSGPPVTAENWRALVWHRLAQASWSEIRREVQAFLEEPQEAEMLSPNVLRTVLGV